MGRHAGPAPAERVPGVGEVLGWGAFTLALVVGALAWFGVPWLVVAGVAAVVLAGLGAVAATIVLSPGRDAPRPAPRDPRVP